MNNLDFFIEERDIKCQLKRNGSGREWAGGRARACVCLLACLRVRGGGGGGEWRENREAEMARGENRRRRAYANKEQLIESIGY